MKRKWIFIKIVKVLFFVSIGIFLFGYITMSLWNCLIPALFHGPIVTYWQAIGLLILGKILFGGFGPRRGGGPWGRHGGGPGNHWGGGPWNRWHQMTPEERAKYKEDWKKMKDKWDAMSPEDRKKAKQQWCRGDRPGFGFEAPEEEPNTPKA